MTIYSDGGAGKGLGIPTLGSETLRVIPWEGPPGPSAGGRPSGFDPRSAYVERFWLPVIGPSTTWLLRRIATGFDTCPGGFEMGLGETGRAIGLGDRSGRYSPLLRTLNRMVRFELAKVAGPDLLAVRRRMPPLNHRQELRLPPALQEVHRRWVQDQLGVPAADAQRRRARHLALSLLELGEDAGAVARQLERWRYPAPVADEATAWAAERHRLAAAAASG